MVFVVVALVEWELVVADLLSDEGTPVGVRLVWASYPVLDAVLIGLVVAVTVCTRSLQPAPLYVALGAALWLVSDLVMALVVDADGLTPLLDVGWLVGGLLLAAAAWSPLTPPRASDARPVDRVRMGIVLSALLVAPVLEVVAWLGGADTDPLSMLAATVVLLVLVHVRADRLLRAQAELHEVIRSRARYSEALAAHSSDAVVVLDEQGRLTRDAPLFAALAHDPRAAVAGADVLSLTSGQDGEEARAAFERALLAPGRVVTSELRGRVRDGQQAWLGVRLVNLLADPDVRGVVVTIADVTDRRRAEEDLAHQAFHDSLTGLPNRALFDDRVTQALHRAARSGIEPAVLYVDLDGFKTVNDTLGHPAGDQLLREVADRLRWATRTGDTVSRLGGDEFAILVERGHDPAEDAAAMAHRLLEALAVPVPIDGEPVRVSGSVGIALGDGQATAASLLRDADIAMYRSKQAGKSCATVFQPHMRSAVLERMRLQTDLVDALAAEQFRLVYQPVVALSDGRVVGFEALLRWDHPTLGAVPPGTFVPIAEDSGLIEPIGRWVLGEAARTAAGWQRAHPSPVPLTMAVNVSARQISSGLLTDQVVAVLAETGVDPSSLLLEITETVLVEDPERAAECLRQLHARGVRLAIDDFGTGWSSLSYLRQFEVDVLKIDRSFIASITDPDEAPDIVHGLVELGRTLGLEIIAEGVETELQRDRLRAERCDLVQGYLFSRPLERADADALLRQQQPAAALPVPAAPLDDRVTVPGS